MATKTMTTAPTRTEAERLVAYLLKDMRAEEIAVKLRVSLNSVLRWKRGVSPQPGHLTGLRELAAQKRSA